MPVEGDLKLGQASRKLTNVRSLATEAMEAPRNSMTDEQARLERELLGRASWMEASVPWPSATVVS